MLTAIGYADFVPTAGRVPFPDICCDLTWVALAVAMVCAAFGVVATRAAQQQAAGFVFEARSFAWISVSDLLVFAGMVAGAIASVGRPETHKRLMLAATVSLLGPPIGRWVLLAVRTFAHLPSAPTGAPPSLTAAYVPHVLSFTLIIVAMSRDRRTIGRVHPTYVGSLAAMVLQLVTLTTIAHSPAWQWIAGHIAALGG